MDQEQMTIHRALSELKLLSSRIENKIAGLMPVGIFQEGKLINGVFQKQDFEQNAVSTYQSIKDLIERKAKLKAAIVKSNATTQVVVAGETMSVADAIVRKELNKHYESLLTKLRGSLSSATGALNKANEQVKSNLQVLLEKVMGKDNVQLQKDAVNSVSEPFLQKETVHLFDPLDVNKAIAALQTTIEGFKADVDAVLSESNAVTKISI